MSVRLENAPIVTGHLRANSLSAGESTPDRESPAEAYSMAPPQFGTDALRLRSSATQALSPAAAPRRGPARPWYADPLASGILALGVAFAIVFRVGGLQLAIVMALVLLGALLLYGLGFDRQLKQWLTPPPPAAPRAYVTGPLR